MSWKGQLDAGRVDRSIIQLDILPTALADAGEGECWNRGGRRPRAIEQQTVPTTGIVGYPYVSDWGFLPSEDDSGESSQRLAQPKRPCQPTDGDPRQALSVEGRRGSQIPDRPSDALAALPAAY